MRITPSGKGKIVTAQGLRPMIESEPITTENIGLSAIDKPEYNPMGDLENALQSQRKDMKATEAPAEEEKPESEKTTKTLSDMYNALLKNLGVTLKLNQDNKYFDYEIDLSGNSANGFFVVPTYVTKDGETRSISQDDANDYAKNMLKDYDVRKLVGKIKPASKEMGPHYRYDYSISPKKEGVKPSSSFDEVLSVEKSAANNKHQLIKDSHEHLINILLEKGFGGKNAT